MMMQDLVTERWEDFLKRYYWDDLIELSNSYPEKRSLFVRFADMDIYDPTIADMLLEDPDVTLEAATRALREMDIPTGVILDEANLRVINLPRKIKIRDIRSNDIGKLAGIEGLVTKATEVRPRIVEAVFECPFCHHIFSIAQSGRQFKEPYECPQEDGGCGRKARQFKLLVEKSKFANAQKIRLQESPEELRGGELPQAIDVNLEDDISGEVSPGGRVIVTGILRSYQRTTQFGKTPFFDIYLDGNSLELKEEEFGEIEITEADEREIMELKNQPDVYEKFIRSIAPSIYGYEEIKEAMILQLFAGVPKELPDETRVRGDIHLLLVGDPGVAKCMTDAEILLSDGSLQDIRTLVDGEASQKISGSVDDGIYIETNHDLVSLDLNGKTVFSKGDLLWKRWATPKMYHILTSSGKEIKVTPTHPFFVCGEDAHLRKKKAEDLNAGEFIATPRKIEVFGTPQPLNINYRRSRARNAVRLKLPSHTTSEFWRFIGLFIAEGYLESKVHNGYPQCTAFFTNNNSQLIEDYRAFAKKLGLNPSYRDSHKGKSAKEIYIPGIEFGTFLENLGAAGPSGSKIVPELLFKCSKGEIAAFLSALFDGEGTVSEKDRKIGITSASRKLLSQVQHLLLRFGIHSQLHPTLAMATNAPHPKKKEYYRLSITGEEIIKFKTKVGFTVAEKKEKLQKICSSTSIYNTNIDVIPNISSLLKEIRTKLRLSQFECGIPRSAYQHYERGDRNPSRSALNSVVQQFEKRINWLAEVRKRLPSSDWHDLRTIRKSLHCSQHEISSSSGFSQTLLSQYELGKIGYAKIKPKKNFAEITKNKVIEALLKRISEMEDVIELVSALKTTVNSDIFWDRVEKIEEFVSEDEFVYDIQVPVYHNFVANDIYVHNSQLLTYLVKLAPRGLYTGGKSSTAAGLTAAAVRDEFGEGRWTLEAGALVLADKGIACIEEKQKVVTPNGLIPIKHLKEGDRIINYNNSYNVCNVKHIIDKGMKKTKKIHLYDGSVIECTYNHEILTSNGWQQAGEISIGDFLIIPADYSDIKIADEEALEKGFIHGFGLLFENNRLPSDTLDFKVGFIAGILSTDCCISHKRGKDGVKHTIEIGLGRRKYSREWLNEKMRLVSSILHEFGILSVVRGRKLLITSLKSYNRVVDVFATHVVGKNKERLYPVAPVRKEPNKTYLLNRVQKIEEGEMKHVYDLTIDGEPNFLIEGGIVHNCVDEIDKMRKEDRDALHEAMEQQSFAPSFELTLPTGDKREIGDLVDGLMEDNPEAVIKGVNCEILPLNGSLCVLTTDFDKIFEVDVDRVSRHLAPAYFIEILVQNGRTVKVTPEHPCWVVRNGGLTTIPAEKVVKGEFLPVPEELPIRGTIQYFDFVHAKRGYHKEVIIPEHNSPEFCRFLGYHLSDGSYESNRGVKTGINFWNSNPALIEDYASLVKNIFGIVPYIQNRGNRNRNAVRITSMHLVDFLRRIDASLLMDKKRRRIPPMIMKSKKEEISQLLRALFEGAGGVFLHQGNSVSIRLTSRNLEIIKQVQELLCRFGIQATIFFFLKNRGRFIG